MLLVYAQEGDITKVTEMLATAHDKCVVDEIGQTALAIAARWGHFEITKTLIEASLPVDHKNKVSFLFYKSFYRLDRPHFFLHAGVAIKP